MADDNQDQLASIDTAALAGVTGGATSSDTMTLMMQSLMSSIQDLAKSRNNGGNFMEQFMPIMMVMAMQRSAQPHVVAAPAPAPAPPPPGDGWTRVA